MRLTLLSTRLYRRFSPHLLLRLLSTSTPTSTPTPITPASPPPPSIKSVKKLLLHEFDPDRALSLLSSLPSSHSSYPYFLGLVARRLSRSGRFDDAAELLDSRLSLATAEPDFASLLSSYGRASIPDRALSAFQARFADGSLTVSVLSFNALLSSFLQSGRLHQVSHLFTSLSEKHHISPDAVSCVILIKSLCLLRKTEDALVMLKGMREEMGISPTLAIYTTIVDSLYKKQNPEAAEKLWNDMVEAGCKPDSGAYNVRISYHALRAETDKVLELFKEMESATVNPNTIVHNFLMVCHFKNENVEDAKKVYKEMLVKKVCLPNAASFRILLDGLCRGRDFEMGLEVFRKSLKMNKVPDFRSMRMFVEGLVKEGKVDQAKEVVVEVKKRFPGNFTDRWEKAEKVLGLRLDDDAALSAQEEAI